MAEGIELAKVFITMIPSMDGSQAAITDLVVPQAEKAGEKAGGGLGAKLAGGMKKYLGPAVVAGAVVGIGKGLYEIGETFDDVVDTIRVGTGATGDALDGLVDDAKAVGKTVPAEWGTIGQVVADVNTRMGLSGETLQTVASQYLEAGRILGQEVDIQKTSAAFSAFKIEGEGVVDAMDTLFQVSQATGVGMNELAAGVQSNAPAMQQLGFSFEETASLVGQLDKAGLDSNKTLAAMSKGLVTLAKDGEEPQAAFRRVTGEISSLVKEGNTAAALDLASGVFGTRAATQFVGAVESGTLALDDLVSGVGATSDTILGVGEETQDFAETWQILKNNATAALEPLASSVFTSLGDALSAVMPYLTGFGEWLADNEWVLGVVAVAIGVTLVAAFFAWAASIWATTVALLANPVTWIVIGILALIAVLVLLIANWDAVVGFLEDSWNGFVEWLANAWQWICDQAVGIWNTVATFFTDLWNGIVTFATDSWNGFVSWLAGLWQGFVNGIGAIWNRVATFFINLWNGVKKTTTDTWNSIVSWVTGIPGRIMNGLAALGNLGKKAFEWFGGVLQSATDRLTAVVSWVTGIPGKILSALGNLSQTLVDSGKNLINGFLDGIKSAWNTVVGWVEGGMETLRGLWPFSPAKWGPFSGRGYVTYSGAALTSDFAASLLRGVPVVASAAEELIAAARIDPVMLSPTLEPVTPVTSDDLRARRSPRDAFQNVFNIHNPSPETVAVVVSQKLEGLG